MFFSKPSKQTTGAVQETMTLEQVRVTMLQLLGQENVNRHRIGQLYNYVVDAKLAEKGGYPNAEAYFDKHLPDLSLAALRMYGAVAGSFSVELTGRLGVTCLSLLLTY